MSTTVSVIIPAYNVENFLEEAVESVFLTKHSEIEIIIVYDASKDSTLSVALSIKDKHRDKVKVLNSDARENLGAGACRNLGIFEATGDVVAFLDADDQYFPNRFTKCLKILEENPDVDGVYENCVLTSFDFKLGNQLTEFKMGHAVLDPQAGVEELIQWRPWLTNSITIRRSALQSVGLFDESLLLGQDAELWLRMIVQLKLVQGIRDEPVAIYRRHPENRYTSVIDKDTRYRILLSVSAYKKSRRKQNANAHALGALKNKNILGKTIYSSNSMRKNGNPFQSLKLLFFIGSLLPEIFFCRIFLNEILAATKDLFISRISFPHQTS